MHDLKQQLQAIYGLRGVSCRSLETPVNDVVAVCTPDDRFALKLYNRASRTAADVRWEIELTTHLLRNGAPVARPVAARGAHVQTLTVGGLDRVAVLFEWAPGAKPGPAPDTYELLGAAAARVHAGADTFWSCLPRERYDIQVLVDDQLELMRAHLCAAGKWQDAVRLGHRLRSAVADPRLDRGVCHMDLTLDNVHRLGDRITIFDLDSAGECWRALEPHGVLRSSTAFFDAWLAGYRSVRPFSARDERAVSAFTVIGDLRAVAWKLGVARSSRGAPLLDVAGLADVVEEWMSREFP